MNRQQLSRRVIVCGVAATFFAAALSAQEPRVFSDNDMAPTRLQKTSTDGDGWAAREIGGDMTFCQLYGLGQYGREWDIVGLSVATTAWNIGDVPLPTVWLPSGDHPFIVAGLYRLETVDGSERFEQIGQSWVNHFFCAIDSSQCTTECEGTGSNSLGVGCTSTNGAGANSDVGAYGPRYEVDPWWREWTYEGSHLSQGSHGHNGIEHRLQVRDVDLDPAQNPGAGYYAESFFDFPEDIDQMNSAAWKPVTPGGSPGGTWTFGMSGPSTPPEIGFAIDAWEGATQTILAQEVPVVEFQSPDGRCVLAAKATDLGEGLWHYEYALLNVDMDRQVGSFGIPVPPSTTVTNVGFHAVQHHDEEFNTTDPDAVPIDNSPWELELTDDGITWSTTSNPLRWGTLYNFRFDADIEPADTTATLGLFRDGTPSEVTGETIGPAPDCNANGIADSTDIAEGTSQDVNENWLPDECEYEGQLLLADDFVVVRGQTLWGHLSDLHASDDARVDIQLGLVLHSGEPPVWVVLEGTAPTTSPAELRFILEAGVDAPGFITQKIELYNYAVGAFEEVDARLATAYDTEIEVLITDDPSRFIEPKTLEMTAQLTWITSGLVAFFPWQAELDVALWTITP